MRRVWKSRKPVHEDLASQILFHRGITGSLPVANFLEPKYNDLHDPFLLKDMDQAVKRILRAIEKQEQITVYADYDADAVTAAAVLLRFFETSGYLNVNYYIPDRFSEGYGLSSEALEKLAAAGTNLVITVDCGINAVEPVSLSQRMGLDVIITDHHRLTGEIPAAAAVVNPHRPDDAYPFKDLTGVGVAFKLVQALTISYKLKAISYPQGFEKWLLDLVAIGTVADCQSLLGENRIFVKWGLVVLGKTRWRGLRKLLELAGLAEQALDTYKIGFVIAPRINAAGRIEHANLALDMLVTNDLNKAAELARKLESLNRHRQALTEQILSEAREQLVDSPDKKILLAAGNWNKGIVGLVAGKLADEFARPVLVMEKGEIEATGSARSVGNFNIIEAIGSSKDILVRYGGHPQAAGFTLRSEHIDLFHQNLLKFAEDAIDEEDLQPVLYYEAEISLAKITPELVGLLEKFAPFGEGNPPPRLRINNLSPRYVSAIGHEGKHLRMSVGGIGCIGFGLGYWAEKLSSGQPVDIICEPQWNEWNGERKIQLKIVDLKLSDGK